MIDIKELKEKLKSNYAGYGVNDKLLLAYTEEQRDLVKNAIDELERLQNIHTIMGINLEDIRFLTVLIREKYATKENFHEALKDFSKAYQKGFDDAKKIIDEAIKTSFIGLLK